jgi:phosphatidylglycerophosphatase A
MKHKIDRRKPENLLDYIAIVFSTFGVGYMPIAPGTFGSMIGIAIYLAVTFGTSAAALSLTQIGWQMGQIEAWYYVINAILLVLLSFLGIWAASRSTELFGDLDPSYAVVDEVIGQLITFLFVPFGLSWPFILAGFLLFRLFDIWKPYPIDDLQSLSTGLGVCADDMLAGVYAGICLAVIYAVSISL